MMHTLKRLLLVVFLLALVAAVLLFVLENQQAVALVMFGWPAPAVPISVVILAALLAGLAVGPLLGAYVAIRAKKRLRKPSV